MNKDRPMDLLTLSLNKIVLVKLKGGRQLRGKLINYDAHLNLTLDDAEEILEEENNSLGTIILRGDNVIIISPPPTIEK
ncbi:RNA-binding protein [Candidatus Heimdallarchaeota archaeon]|nr:MAG: RNA-binding protein [Candidatus Gerdarchaeota archaeon]RLI74374.1 MAG: RNA-binding protein [Candidatus Heimdallarchaeota archaeon]